MNIVIKEGDSSIKNFIFSSWVKCYIHTVEAELMGIQEATKFMHSFITKKWDEGVKVSYVGDDETDEIYSYVVFDPKEKRIYFGYTKSIYRKDGLFHSLMEHNNLSGYDFCFIFNGAIARNVAAKYNLTYKPLGR